MPARPSHPTRRAFLAGVAGVAGTCALTRLARGRPPGAADGPPLPAGVRSQVDAAVARMLQQYQAPSATIAVCRGGRASYVQGYGKVKLPDGSVPDGDTIYAIGSLSKGLTAVGAMQLVEKGKVRLNAPASEYIRSLPPAWRQVTVRQFMCHTSGIPDVPRKQKVAAAGQIDAVYHAMADVPMAFPTGTKYVYNNFNFDLIGNLIERVSGKPYLDYMKANVFAPAGMTRSGAGPIDTSGNGATGYEGGENGIHPVKAEVLEIGTPSGGLTSTAADLLKLGRALNGHQLLGPAALTEMVTPYGHFISTPGWFARQTPKAGTVAFKDGATGGYMSFMTFVPAEGHVAVVLRNLQKLKTPVAPLCNQLLHLACGVAMPGA